MKEVVSTQLKGLFLVVNLKVKDQRRCSKSVAQFGCLAPTLSPMTFTLVRLRIDRLRLKHPVSSEKLWGPDHSSCPSLIEGIKERTEIMRIFPRLRQCACDDAGRNISLRIFSYLSCFLYVLFAHEVQYIPQSIRQTLSFSSCNSYFLWRTLYHSPPVKNNDTGATFWQEKYFCASLLRRGKRRRSARLCSLRISQTFSPKESPRERIYEKFPPLPSRETFAALCTQSSTCNVSCRVVQKQRL